jgi:STE24 endopeptidase
MFNLLGILAALIIAGLAQGAGMMVGWESPLAVAVGVVAVLLFSNSVASHLVERRQLLRLRMKAAVEAGLSDVAEEAQAELGMLQRQVGVFRLATDGMIVAMFLGVAVVFGWVDFVREVMGVPRHLDVLPSIFPYFAMLAASWVGQYRIERHVRRSDWTPGRFVAFQTRANGMTVAPVIVVFALWWAVLRYVPAAADLVASFKYLEIAGQMALVFVVMLFAPVLLRLVLPGGALPPGRLRRRLESFARDRGLRVGRILVWRTGGHAFATAFVIGLVGPVRYVFLTDALLRRLSDDEILAVYAHELGHVHHRHLWWLLAFLFSFVLVLLGTSEALVALQAPPHWHFVSVVLPLVYGYLLFGYVSRRFERQADAFAARHTSPELLTQVFLKLGLSNPTAMRRDGWRHFSLERRIREMMLTRARPEVRRLFAAELSRGLLLGLAVTVASLVLLVQPVHRDVVSGLATFQLTRYDRARAGDADPARLNELAERARVRAAAMARLDAEHERYARWYEGIVLALSHGRNDPLQDMLAEARRKAAASRDVERREWERWARTLEASVVSAERAREHNTSFFEELDRELGGRAK